MSIPDRIERAFRALVESILSEKLYGIYPYAVTSFDEGGQTVDAAPLGGSGDLPTVSKLKIRSPKIKPRISSGDQVAIAFAGGDPAQPFVIALDYTSTLSTALPAARQGDAVSVLIPPAIFTGTISGAPASGVVQWALPQANGTIAGGSGEVKIP